MSEGGYLGTNGVWKWIAAVLTAILLTGLPGYVRLYVGSPSREEVSLIRDRQDAILQRLAALDIRVNGIDAEQMRLWEELEKLNDAFFRR